MSDMNAMRDAHRQMLSALLGSPAWTKTDGTQGVASGGLLESIQQNFSGQIQDMVTQMEGNQATAAQKKEQLASLRFYQGQIKDKDDTAGLLDIYFSVYSNSVTAPPSFDSSAVMVQKDSRDVFGLLGTGDGISGSFDDQHGYVGHINDRRYEDPANSGQYLNTAYAWTLSNGGISQADAYKEYQKEIDRVEADLQSLSTVSQQQQVRLNAFSNKYTEMQTLASNLSKAFYSIALDIARRMA